MTTNGMHLLTIEYIIFRTSSRRLFVKGCQEKIMSVASDHAEIVRELAQHVIDSELGEFR